MLQSPLTANGDALHEQEQVIDMDLTRLDSEDERCQAEEAHDLNFQSQPARCRVISIAHD